MLDTKVAAYNALKNSSALTAALGGASKILFTHPQDFNLLPVVTYQELNNRNADFYDNTPFSEESTIQVDVWTRDTSTTPICKIIDSIFEGLFYTRDYSGDTPDPDVRIFHRVMRYRRTFTADDLDLV